jgi:hypothetical protein
MPPKSTRSPTRSPRPCMQSDAPACEIDVQVPTADCDGMADQYDVIAF